MAGEMGRRPIFDRWVVEQSKDAGAKGMAVARRPRWIGAEHVALHLTRWSDAEDAESERADRSPRPDRPAARPSPGSRIRQPLAA
jgi:hypothetical protein